MSLHGKFYWNELMTRNPQKAIDFYGEVLGWSFSEFPMEDGSPYWIALDGHNEPVCGVFPMIGPEFDGIPEHWFAYVAVDDVDARVAQAPVYSGKVLRPAMDVPGVGRIAIIADVNGAALGLMTPVIAALDDDIDEDGDEDAAA